AFRERKGTGPVLALLGVSLKRGQAPTRPRWAPDHTPACSDRECRVRTNAHVLAAGKAAVVRMRISRPPQTPRLYECVVPGDRECRICTNAWFDRAKNAAIVPRRPSRGKL